MYDSSLAHPPRRQVLSLHGTVHRRFTADVPDGRNPQRGDHAMAHGAKLLLRNVIRTPGSRCRCMSHQRYYGDRTILRLASCHRTWCKLTFLFRPNGSKSRTRGGREARSRTLPLFFAHQAERGCNSLITCDYSIARTPKREMTFRWRLHPPWKRIHSSSHCPSLIATTCYLARLLRELPIRFAQWSYRKTMRRRWSDTRWATGEQKAPNGARCPLSLSFASISRIQISQRIFRIVCPLSHPPLAVKLFIQCHLRDSVITRTIPQAYLRTLDGYAFWFPLGGMRPRRELSLSLLAAYAHEEKRITVNASRAPRRETETPGAHRSFRLFSQNGFR